MVGAAPGAASGMITLRLCIRVIAGTLISTWGMIWVLGPLPSPENAFVFSVFLYIISFIKVKGLD